MKRSELIISVLLALMFLTPISLKAQISFTVGDINYWITDTDAKEIRVDKYVGSDDILTLPVPGTVTYDNQEFTVTSIGANAFYNCNSLKEINIPSSVTSIGYGAFSGCTNLVDINIPEGITSIEDYTFSRCESLREITIPSSVTSIGVNAFRSCNALREITIPEGVTSIGNYAFSECHSLSEITIPSSVTSIGRSAFFVCTGLEKFIIPEGVTAIESSTFAGCMRLSEIIILGKITSIGNSAFNYCNFTKITIPEGVTSIGIRAFYHCDSLSEITIPSSVTSIGEQAFSGCTNLAKVNIPEGVTSIGDYTFYECKSLSEITIPSSVTSIGKSAFSGCTNLAEVNISEGVTSIEYEAFMACSGLKTITLPNSITSIGEKAFYGCWGLHTITLPDKITNIGYEAFMNCLSLDTLITLSENPPTLDDEVFDTKSGMVVLVPKGSETAYKNAKGWKDFEIKIIIENPVTSITLNTEQLTMEYGTKEQLTATVAPDYADYPGLTWTSDNEEVATVDENGQVTAVGVGEANITATAADGSGVTATCKVTVTPKLVTSVTLDQSELTVERTYTAQLSATIAPEDADNRTVSWTSDNEEVATVDENGLVTAVGEGTATITATANDGSGVAASCVVTVTFIDGIADIETSKVTVLAANGRITVSGKEKDDTVSVYDTVGRLLYRGESDVIDVPRKAMYIVTVSRKSYKVVVQ